MTFSHSRDNFWWVASAVLLPVHTCNCFLYDGSSITMAITYSVKAWVPSMTGWMGSMQCKWMATNLLYAIGKRTATGGMIAIIAERYAMIVHSIFHRSNLGFFIIMETFILFNTKAASYIHVKQFNYCCKLHEFAPQHNANVQIWKFFKKQERWAPFRHQNGLRAPKWGLASRDISF